MDRPFQILQHPFEKTENTQVYVNDPFCYVHKEPARHILGIVGGNEVSLPKGNMVDVESDLFGLNIPLTKCPAREYQPAPKEQTNIIRKSTKGSVDINVQQRHLPAIQMWPYAPTFAPVPMNAQQCGRPEKY
jgi:hypothetical protein